MFRIGDIADDLVAEFHPVSGRPIRMIEMSGFDGGPGMRRQRFARFEILERDTAFQGVHGHGKQGIAHKRAQYAFNRQPGIQMAGPYTEPVLWIKRKGEKWKSIDMVNMSVRQEQIGFRNSFRDQPVAHFTRAGPRVEHQDAFATSDFNTGRIAAVLYRLWPWARDAAAHSPKPN